MIRLILFTAYFVMNLLLNSSAMAEPYTAEELPSGYMTIVDEKGVVVFQTGLAILPGDSFINEDNKVYEVTAVEGTLARSRFVGEESLAGLIPDSVPVQGENNPPPKIGLYHTHSDESYIPTDGKSSHPGKGTIKYVGEAFSNRLNDLGYETIHSTNAHEPHDANAYHRSRRTFLKLLEQRPVALFDIHRDSAPLSAYKATINGKDAARILLVVGRQNQNRATTMNYAKSLKAACDSKYRGLVRGIFIAHGNYNQDLNPRAMLIEIGTQYNRREAAEYSISLFADAIPAVLSASAGSVAQASPVPGNNAVEPETTAPGWGQDAALIIAVLVGGSAAFLLISTGSVREAKEKLKHFMTREFRDVFRFRRKRKS